MPRHLVPVPAPRSSFVGPLPACGDHAGGALEPAVWTVLPRLGRATETWSQNSVLISRRTLMKVHARVSSGTGVSSQVGVQLTCSTLGATGEIVALVPWAVPVIRNRPRTFLHEGVRSMGRLLVLLVVILCVIGLGTAPALAHSGCGPGFTPTTVREALSMFPGSEAAIRSGDSNGDGALCYKVVGGAPRFVDS